MKKITLLVTTIVLLSSSLFSQSKPLLDNFLASEEFSRVSNCLSLASFGNVNYSLSAEGDDLPVELSVIYADQNGFYGCIKAFKIPDSLSNVLPGDEHYMMVLYDYSNYDTASKTGTVKIVDLNYDEFIPLEVTCSTGTMTDLFIQAMPDSIKEKYSDLLKKKDFGNPIYEEVLERAPHYCDLNGNGNVGWGECFTCLAGACANNQTCNILCSIINWAGVILIGEPSCTASIAASCAIIAIFY